MSPISTEIAVFNFNFLRYNKHMNSAKRPVLELPEGQRKYCCTPVVLRVRGVIETMLASGITPTIFFYNPNIHPKKEYEIRKSEDKRFCEKLGILHVDVDYDVRNWFERVKGLEWEPERGLRCTQCFDMRFERTALYAKENGFRVFTSSLGISRWKNMTQINGCGERAASRYDNLTYWTYNWRKSGGSQRMIEISKEKVLSTRILWLCVFASRYQQVEVSSG